MHSLLNKLRIIATLQEGQKLDISNGMISIYNDNFINWLYRKWNRDSKVETIKFITDLFKSLEQSVIIYIDELSNDNKKNNSILILIITAVEIQKSILGLNNLIKTYSNYQATIAHINGIKKDYIENLYKKIIENIPLEKMPKDLNVKLAT